MTGSLKKELVEGFVEEARGYLPHIQKSLDAMKSHPSEQKSLEEAHRYIHTIKGAASMVGFPGLGHIANFVEEALEEIAAEETPYDARLDRTLRRTLDSISAFLDGIQAGDLNEKALLTKAAKAFRRFRGLPAKGDKDAVDALLRDTARVPLGEMATGGTGLDEAATELLETFLLEAQDHLQALAGLLATIEKTEDKKPLFDELRRRVHSLKGSSGLVGFPLVSRLAHRMEDLLDRLYEDRLAFNKKIMTLLFETTDALEDLINQGPAQEEQDEAESQANTMAEYDRILGTLEEVPVPLKEGEAGETLSADTKQPHLPFKLGDVVRVPIERLDELVRLVGELAIQRSRYEQYFRRLTGQVGEIHPTISRLRRIATQIETRFETAALSGARVTSGVPEISSEGVYQPSAFIDYGFDELEFDRYTEFHILSRELTETTSDIHTVGMEMRDVIRDFDSYLVQSSRLTSEIQEKLMKLRMVPLATIAARLFRTVRVTSARQGRLADLHIEGEGVELDKKVLEELADPLIHILRNAVDHGIEPPDLRAALGKPETGQIVIQAQYSGTEVVIRISDDGAGIETQRVRAQAVAGGYVTEKQAESLEEPDLFNLLFIPGFTTAQSVSEVSGRGIGMDVVKATVEKLKGSVNIQSRAGSGVTLTIRLPLTLAVLRVLLVGAHQERFAVPLAGVRKIVRLDEATTSKVGHESMIKIDGVFYPAVPMGQTLGLRKPADPTVKRRPALILDIGGKEAALVVDHLLEAREVVVKSLGSHLRKVKGISGATLMGDGSVVLILNPSELIQPVPTTARTETFSYDKQETVDILIVDDSLSVRKVLTNLVRGAGWRPIAVRDGVEALDWIRKAPRPPDLILLDIEMPRMDGYELTAVLRGQEAFRDIPIVIITSRAAEKHRQKAFEVGVTDYLVKPFREPVLLALIEKFTGNKEGSPAK